jgi:hypothetical protein
MKPLKNIIVTVLVLIGIAYIVIGLIINNMQYQDHGILIVLLSYLTSSIHVINYNQRLYKQSKYTKIIK